MTDDEIITAIIQREGGYVDHPADHGGPTRYGITLDTLAAHRGYEVTADDVMHLSETEARDIYRTRYLVDSKIIAIQNPQVRGVVLDAAVNHGIRPAIKLLQRALGVVDDGLIGPKTLAAVPHLDGRRLSLKVLAHRAKLYGRIITNSPSQAVFASGWMNRLAEMILDVA